MKIQHTNYLLFACVFSALFLMNCSKSDAPTPDPGPDPTLAMVKLSSNATLGSILTDQDNKTLYFYTKDAGATSNCTGSCISNWPVYHIETLAVASGLSTGDFSEITRADGSKQTTYKGWPLYYFANDNSAGDTNGENVNNVWYVAKPDYTIMLVNSQLIGHDGKMYTGSFAEGTEEVQYFIDGLGRTLYSFKNDKFGINKFTASDFSNNGVWPIYESSVATPPSALDARLFSFIDVFGKSQMTFNGWPLYYFGQDNMMRGSNKGVSFPTPGVWPVVGKDFGEAPSDCDMSDITYSGFVKPIMTNSCAVSGCHNTASSASGLDLSVYDTVKSIADNGKLFGTISWAGGFSAMPKNESKLDQCTIDIIKAWIDAGANND